MSMKIRRQPGEIVNEVFSECVDSLIKMCTDVGDDPQMLIEQMRSELRKMVVEMMAEDESLLAQKRTEIALIRARYQSLFHDLHPDKTCPIYENSSPILLALRIYHDELKKLQEEHSHLVERETQIRAEERQLCHELNTPSLQIDHEYFLSKPLVTQISLLSQHVDELKEEKAKRIAHLSEILRILNDFEHVYGWKRPKIDTIVGRLVELGFDRLDEFSLNKETIDLVDKELTEITEQIQNAEFSFEQSNKQLETLIRTHQSILPNPKILALTVEKRCRLSKLPDLIAEVDRYKEHAMEKLTNDILKARERIFSVLAKLSVNDANENSKFAILTTNDFTDDVYFMHEELLQELEAQYEVNKSLYEQIEIWNELFLEFQQFEKSATDPQRFHRRGYSALHEEKTRKRLELALRECEVRLQHLSEDFTKRNDGKIFIMTSNGKGIVEYLQERKNEYVKSKETAKTPSSQKKVRSEALLRPRPTPLQTIVGNDDNANLNEENQCATILCVSSLRKKKYFL